MFLLGAAFPARPSSLYSAAKKYTQRAQRQKETSWCRGDARAAMAWRNDDQEQRREARVSTSVAMHLRKCVRNIIYARPVTTSSLTTCSAGHVADDTNQMHTKIGCVSEHTCNHTSKVTVSRGEGQGRSAIDARSKDDGRGERGWRTLHRTRLGGGAPPPTGWWRLKRGRGIGNARAAMVWRIDDQEQRNETRVSTSVAMHLRKYVRNIIQSRPVTTSSLTTCSPGHVADDTNQRHTKIGCVSKHTCNHTSKVTVSRGEGQERAAIDARNKDDGRGEGGWRTLHRTRLGGGAPPPTGWWRFKRGRGAGSSCAVV